MENEIQHMQVRLFEKAWKKWKISLEKCADIFDRYDLDGYISDMYEFFHVQGDDANIEELEEHLAQLGVSI